MTTRYLVMVSSMVVLSWLPSALGDGPTWLPNPPSFTAGPTAVDDGTGLPAGGPVTSGAIDPGDPTLVPNADGFSLTNWRCTYKSAAADVGRSIKIKFTIERRFTVAGGHWNTAMHSSGVMSFNGGRVLQVYGETDVVEVVNPGGAEEYVEVPGSRAIVVAENNGDPQGAWDPGTYIWTADSSGIQRPFALHPKKTYVLRQTVELWLAPSAAGQTFKFLFVEDDANRSSISPGKAPGAAEPKPQ
jgi:hypothetical protein